MTNSTVSGNSASYDGGGIFSRESRELFTLTNSTVSGNSAGHDGGGIYSGGSLILTNSTVSGNSAGHDGGGINSGAGSLTTLTNSTISGNSAVRRGGGIHFYYSTLKLTGSTLSGNSAASGGGIFSFGSMYDSTVTLTNSIIANSKSGSDCSRFTYELPPVTGSKIIYKGKNLIEDGSCKVVEHGGLKGDPKLGPLIDNGGPTLTHALLTGSIALNAASDAAQPVQFKDQRGAKRPQGVHRDIGAFELISTAEATLQPVITFFDQKIASGELLGTGGSQIVKLQRLGATRQQLLMASDFIMQAGAANKSKACDQIKKTLSRIDTNLTPDINDYVTGTAGDDLATMVQSVRTDLSCS